jgi:hypothetical protein
MPGEDVVVDMGVTLTTVESSTSNDVGNTAPSPTTSPHLVTAFYKFKDVEQNFNNSYNPKESNNSVICDIIAIYVKGQKILYTEAKTHCEQRLTFLMLPAILITVICSVLGVILKEYDYGTTITSSLNGVNAFLLALISYLKLDTRAEAHRTTAYKLDKLQASLEFTSGKMLFVSEMSNQLGKIIDDTEAEIRDIKETNQFVLPEAIRYNFPKLCNTNVFAIVKKIQNKEMRLTNDLKDLCNERAALQEHTDATSQELKRADEKINAITDNILKVKDEYVEIDNTFETEITTNRNRKLQWWRPRCGCLKV